jgi:hypothetical protein
MRFTSHFALATAATFSVSALPVRAFPGASVNLVRLNGDGLTALPTLLPSKTQVPASNISPLQLISQASGDSQSLFDVTTLPAGSQNIEIQYTGPLPQFSPSDYISLRNKATGQEVQRIFLNSDRVSFSSDRRTIAISPELSLTPDEVICALLPDGPGILPSRTTPCCFTVAAAAAAATPYVAPAANPFPWWIIPVGLGLGVGICAIAGCFDGGGGGGGGGGNNVSR